jgi:hypothetical protein
MKLYVASAAMILLAGGGALAVEESAGARIRLAQTSTTTACMAACNTQVASCQSACIVPGTASTTGATTASNPTASASCLLTCSTQQSACQTVCARTSPSQ